LHQVEVLFWIWLTCDSFKEAHDAEILTLDFSNPETPGSKLHLQPNFADTPHLLASGSRDRLIHIFDLEEKYNLVATLDDHSSSITAVKFAMGGSKLLSCSADKSIVFRSVTQSPESPLGIARYHQAAAPYGTVFDMDVDATNKYIVTAGQEKRLNIYTIATGKASRSYKVEGDSGELIKVKLDPAGLYAATSSSGKIRYSFSDNVRRQSNPTL
jgi:WD40 repeat protein